MTYLLGIPRLRYNITAALAKCRHTPNFVSKKNNIKSLSKLLRKLFAQKAQLEEEEAKFQEEQELLNQKYMELSELYEEPKK